MKTAKPKVGSLASWYGSNRMLAPVVGSELAGCSWVGVVFAGGMSEVAHIDARTLQINDLHRHMMNLARVCADPKLGPTLYRKLRRMPFHPDVLAVAQQRCAMREANDGNAGDLFGGVDKSLVTLGDHGGADPSLMWAVDYFIASWMARHGKAGAKDEFTTGISTRWTATGGDSAAHYWSAVDSLAAWRNILRRANFTTLDFREFLDRCADEPGIGIYSDAPFFGPGDAYKHSFTLKDQTDLADRLSRFTKARVVVRFYDVPLIRELYPESKWTWRLLKGRTQTNGDAAEVLLINGKSIAQGAQKDRVA